MTGRNCVAIDRNAVCCRGMVFRMQHLKGLPGPNVECGDAAGVCVDAEEAEEEEVEVQAGRAGQAGQAPSSSGQAPSRPSRSDKEDDDEDFSVNHKPLRSPGALVM